MRATEFYVSPWGGDGILCPPQDTQEFLRCLMDQLHEELKEPLSESCGAPDEGGDDPSDHRDPGGAERPPSEDEFLSCDSGSSSDRGEGGSPGVLDDPDGARPPAAGGPISVKERLKERRVSGAPLRGGSQEMDEDADVDTAAELRRGALGAEAPEAGPGAQEPGPLGTAEVPSREDRPPEGSAGQTHSSSTAGNTTHTQEDTHHDRAG